MDNLDKIFNDCDRFGEDVVDVEVAMLTKIDKMFKTSVVDHLILIRHEKRSYVSTTREWNSSKVPVNICLRALSRNY